MSHEYHLTNDDIRSRLVSLDEKVDELDSLMREIISILAGMDQRVVK